MNRDEIIAELFRLQDKDYALMQTRIISTVTADRITICLANGMTMVDC